MSTGVRWCLFGLLLVNALAWSGLACRQWRTAEQDRTQPEVLVLPLRVDRRGEAQLFFDVGRGMNETDSVTVTVWPTRTQRELRFALPRQPIQALRFDPLRGEGWMELGEPRIERASGRVLAKLPLSSVRPQQQIAEFQPKPHGLFIASVPHADDPILEIRLDHPLTLAPASGPSVWIVVAAVVSVILVLGFRGECRQALAQGWHRWQGLLGDSRGGWIGAVLLAAVQLWILWPMHEVADLPFWDEAAYLSWGTRWLEAGSPGRYLFNCPLYVLQYAAESRLLRDSAAAFFFNHYFLKTAGVVLLYLVLARWWRMWPTALGIALLWVGSAFQSEQSILVYHAAWIWFLLAILAVERSPLLALLCLLAATAVRQEYQFAAIAFVGWTAWDQWRNRRPWSAVLFVSPRRSRLVVIGGVALAAMLGYLALEVSLRGGVGRAWFAFRQHYAVRAVLEGREPGLDPWKDYGLLARRDFPGAETLLEAVTTNPGAVSRHLWANLKETPGAILRLVQPADERWPLVAGTGLGVLLLVWWAQRATRPRQPGRFNGTPVAVAALPALAPGLVVFAKDAYLLAALPAAALALSSIGRWLVDRLPRFRSPGAWFPSVILVLMIGANLAGPRPFAKAPPVRPLAESVAALDFHWPAKRLRLLAVPAVAYQTHLGRDRCEGVEGLASVLGRSNTASLSDLLGTVHPDVVIFSPEWTSSASFDSAAADRLAESPEWRSLPLTNGRAFFRVE